MKFLPDLSVTLVAIAILNGSVAAAQPHPTDKTWSGIYAGGQVGGQFTRTDVEGLASTPMTTHTERNRNGLFGGGQFGYGRQVRSFYLGGEVVSVFGQFVNGHVAFSVSPVATGEYTTYRRFLGTAQGKVGLPLSRWLLYGIAGFAAAHLEQGVASTNAGMGTATGNNTTDSWAQVGYIVGGGVEYRVRRKLSVLVESDYYRLQNETLNTGSILGGVTSHNLGTTVHVGANYRF